MKRRVKKKEAERMKRGMKQKARKEKVACRMGVERKGRQRERETGGGGESGKERERGEKDEECYSLM